MYQFDARRPVLARQDQVRRALEALSQALGVFVQDRLVAVELGQLRPAECGGQLVVPVHPAQRVGVVIAALRAACASRRTTRACVAFLSISSSSVTNIPPSPEQRHLFWLKLNAAQCPHAPDFAPLERRSVRLACVLDHFQLVLLRDRHHLLHVHRQAVQVHGDDGLRLLRDRLLDERLRPCSSCRSGCPRRPGSRYGAGCRWRMRTRNRR